MCLIWWKTFLKFSNCWLPQFFLFPTMFSKAIVFKVIYPFPKKPWFLCVSSTSLLIALWEKEKLLVTSNLTFSHSVFYPFGELSAIFIKFEIVVCNFFNLEESKICFWERVKACDCMRQAFFNPLPDMPILGSSNSAANKDMMSNRDASF